MLKLLFKHRNMNIHSYLIKLFRNNFITFLHFYKFLNYKLNLIRNDFIF